MGLSLLTTTFHEGPMRNRAISVYSAFGASGFSLGLVLSGLLTEVSWRWTLLVPAPVALLTLIAAIRVIPRGAGDSPATPGARRERRFDVPGAVTASQITSAQATLSAYRPALALISVVSALGAITALSGLLPRRDAALAAAPAKSAPVRAEDLPAELAREADEARSLEAADVREAGRECGEPLNA